MAAILFVLAVGALLGATLINATAQSSIHQIYGAVLGLTSAVLLGAACIVDAIKDLKRSVLLKLDMKGEEAVRALTDLTKAVPTRPAEPSRDRGYTLEPRIPDAGIASAPDAGPGTSSSAHRMPCPTCKAPLSVKAGEKSVQCANCGDRFSAKLAQHKPGAG